MDGKANANRSRTNCVISTSEFGRPTQVWGIVAQHRGRQGASRSLGSKIIVSQQAASKRSGYQEFNEATFSEVFQGLDQTICPGMRRVAKATPKSIYLLNAVSLDKLGNTERAYFLAADFQAVKQPDGAFVVPGYPFGLTQATEDQRRHQPC